MNDLPLISIVTPSLNQASYLEATLQSVLNQDYPRIEYIVIDGASTDGSTDILRRYEARLAYWVSEPDHGQSEAINKGTQQAHGQVLAYLNSDDCYLPGALRAVAEFFDKRPDVGLAYGGCQVIGQRGEVLGSLPRREFNLKRMIERGEYIPQPAAFWRRAVIEKAGPFDDRLQYAMDYDFFIRAGRTAVVARLPQTLAAFRLHAGSKTVVSQARHWQESMQVAERHGLRPWHAWYWLCRLRHYGARALPAPARHWLAGRLGRVQGAPRTQEP